MPKPYSYDLRQKVIQAIELDGMTYILHQATRSRTPGASSRRSRPTHWLGYTGKTRLRGF